MPSVCEQRVGKRLSLGEPERLRETHRSQARYRQQVGGRGVAEEANVGPKE